MIMKKKQREWVIDLLKGFERLVDALGSVMTLSNKFPGVAIWVDPWTTIYINEKQDHFPFRFSIRARLGEVEIKRDFYLDIFYDDNNILEKLDGQCKQIREFREVLGSLLEFIQENRKHYKP